MSIYFLSVVAGALGQLFFYLLHKKGVGVCGGGGGGAKEVIIEEVLGAFI